MHGKNKSGSNFICIDKKYQLNYNQKLGEGVCGAVYLGCYYQDHQDNTASVKENKLLAIKEIPINSKFETADSLLIEINILRRLKHKSIVRFIDAKKNNHNMYLIMEFCSGGTVEDYIIKKKDELTENDIAKLMAQIVQGFKVLYKNNVMHRDIKPANILLQDGWCKLADFGMAKIIHENTTQNYHTTFKGTMTFIAPQLIMRQNYTDKSDVWSLGVTFYFMLFKTYPWKDPSPVTLLNTIKTKLKSDNIFPTNTYSPQILDLIRKMLQYEEADRISWIDLFDHPVFQDHFKENTSELRIGGANLSSIRNDSIKSRNKQGMEDEGNKKEYDEEIEQEKGENEDSDEDEQNVEPLTKKSFECSISYQPDGIMHEKIQMDMAITEYQVTKKFQKINEEQSQCRKCLQLIKNEWDKALFFRKCSLALQKQYQDLQITQPFQNFNSSREALNSNEDGSCNNFDISEEKKNSLIPSHLYQKCQFLLLKRSYILIYNLYEIVSFRSNHFQGSVEIKKDLWERLLKTKNDALITELQYFNEGICKDKDQIQKQYQNQVIQFVNAQKTYQVFDLIDRGDAFNKDSLNENQNLILAYNDNFKELFEILGNLLIKSYKEKKQKSQAISKHALKRDNKIDVLFIYDILIILCFRNLEEIIANCEKQNPQIDNSKQQIQINFEKYYEDRKLADCLELICRIEKVHSKWFAQNKSEQNNNSQISEQQIQQQE